MILNYKPCSAAVIFCSRSAPEIVMREVFRCQHEFPAEAWASGVVRAGGYSEWLAEEIQILSVQYFYTWEGETSVAAANHEGAHRRRTIEADPYSRAVGY